MAGLLLLLGLCTIMAVASFAAGLFPLCLRLSQSRMRLISSISIGILVGTSLIVIIPEGIEAVAAVGLASHSHGATEVRGLRSVGLDAGKPKPSLLQGRKNDQFQDIRIRPSRSEAADPLIPITRADSEPVAPAPENKADEEHEGMKLPTFHIGFALVSGFVLMFLIDRIPRHTIETFQAAAPQHMSMDNLGASEAQGEGDDDSLLSGSGPSAKQQRGFATTIGLVIHAAADGIAMGASATTSDMKLGLIIFVAIMFHKAPAAFALTSVLLKQGLSKRATRGHLIVFSLAAPFGALSTYMIISLIGGSLEGENGQWWTGMLLLFSAGTFLYVAMHAMQEDSHPHQREGANSNAAQKQIGPQMRDTLATVGGMLLPLLTQFGHHH